jgi:large subunit ribosomal protein L29
MKIGDVRALKTDELYGDLDRLRRHLFDLRSQAVTEKLADSSQLKKTQRDIARVLTVLQQRGETHVEEKEMHLEAVASQKAGPKKKDKKKA